MMTSTQIRQSFLDFFRSKQHTIVPSSSLMPDSPNLLFTNAGMNQFVPIFLNQTPCPYTPGRAADTQKCIRAGGKHNDLDDVGLDTYHHTFFEMLGNWSFGDYFKQEAISWAWELVIEVWKFPPQRLYATVYNPDKVKGDPSEFDQEAWNFWAEKFRSVGLDPAIHIVNGNKKDNFWMMGETGPCGPCSELHVDLTPLGDTQGSLVNKGDARCIEIWNNVFIQFNANPDGTFSPLPAKHVDTGMGFERVTSIMQGTKGLTDFANAKISNYETDIFRPIFDELEKMSGKKYGSTLPPKITGESREQIREIVSAIGVGKVLTCGDVGALCVPVISDQAVSSSIRSQENEIAWWRVVNAAGELPVEHRDVVQAVEQRTKLKAEGVVFAGDNVDLSKSRFETQQWQVDVAFRVIGDHIRTLSFAIADGIQPGNTDRNYVLRRILRRAVRYGRTLGFHEPFFYKLVDVLAATMGEVFPEIRTRKQVVKDVLKVEEESFNKTLDEGILKFDQLLAAELRSHDEFRLLKDELLRQLRRLVGAQSIGAKVFKTLWITAEKLESVASTKANKCIAAGVAMHLRDCLDYCEEGGSAQGSPISYDTLLKQVYESRKSYYIPGENYYLKDTKDLPSVDLSAWLEAVDRISINTTVLGGSAAFILYDTYGFPLDLTELMARERGLTVDVAGFNALMEEQKARARAAQKRIVIEVSNVPAGEKTKFVGYDQLKTRCRITNLVTKSNGPGKVSDYFAAVDVSTLFAEMGGQVGDTGRLHLLERPETIHILDTIKRGDVFLLKLDSIRCFELEQLGYLASPLGGEEVEIEVENSRRDAIQRHHTVTHLLHWALHEVVSQGASQKGSFVGPDKLTFDFNSAALTPAQVADIERLVNERIVENAGVSWTEVAHADVKSRKDVMQFFGDKYGDTVRVVQIGGGANKLDGYSMELCGGTHTRATGEIGLFRIVSEGAIAAGVRRIEAVAGLTAFDAMRLDRELIRSVAAKLSSPLHELEKKVEALLSHQKDLEKALKTSIARNAAQTAAWLLTRVQEVNGVPLITQGFPDGDADYLQAVVDALKSHFKGVVVLGGAPGGVVTLIANVSPDFTAKAQAGKIIQAIAPIVGGKGGGKPDNARGGGKDASKLAEALVKVKTLLG